ncbi:uncharacterized protein LOC121378820 [Gigantopelta aegis]|uniref:uncharacterized protein LOC121378820 n=1 Tax=Gigantopelta aegis TaxID=1735272 RepID=UPI001B88CBCF|nr:uncharacterized protein LOC121378820 [Gigantopelta aegis]
MHPSEVQMKKMSPLCLPKSCGRKQSRVTVTSEESNLDKKPQSIRFQRGAMSRENTLSNQEVPSSDTNLDELRKSFGMADRDGQSGLNIEQFVEAVKRTTTKVMSEDEIRLIFMKMDVDCNGTVDWTEYVTYHMFTRQVNSQLMQMLQEKPFVNEMKTVTARTHEPIVSIVFFPHVTKHSTKYDYKDGKYVTLSKDGIISFWTLEMKHKVNLNINHDDTRVNRPWFLGMVCMYNASILALATTDREFVFVDITTDSFLKRFVITGLENCVTAMHFWTDLRDRRFAILAWGDTHGNTYALYFKVLRGGGLFASTSDKKDTAKKASYSEIMRGLVPYIRCYKLAGVHEDWVCQIKFVPELKGFISCCQRSNTSLFVADFIKNRTPVYYKVNKGLTCFDYCSVLNVIVTGGIDCAVRVWNPYLTHRAIAFLKGHTRPIIYVFVNSNRSQVLSIDQDKAINIFGLKDQTWVQHIGHRIVRLGPFPLTATFFNEKLQHLILATNHLGMMEQKYETKPTDAISHKNPVVVSLYNKTFKYLVTACEGSVVSIWDIKTGSKVMQFINAHTSVTDGIESPIEITAMTFDSQEKRVLTGARNGTVKVWNFNNGSCLQEFAIREGTPVVAIVCIASEVYVTGWSRNVSVFVDGASNECRKTWMTRHHEDILSMAYQAPHTIATSSYDGDIILWLRDTGQAVSRLNAHESDRSIDLTHDYRRHFSMIAVSFSECLSESTAGESNTCVDVDEAADRVDNSTTAVDGGLVSERQNGGLTPERSNSLVLERKNSGVSPERRNSLAQKRQNGSVSPERKNSLAQERRNGGFSPERTNSLSPTRHGFSPERRKSLAPERQSGGLTPERRNSLPAQSRQKSVSPQNSKNMLSRGSYELTPETSQSWEPERRNSSTPEDSSSWSPGRQGNGYLAPEYSNLTPERKNSNVSETPSERRNRFMFKRSLFADLMGKDEENVVVVQKKKSNDFYEHPLLWALDKKAIVSQGSKYRPRKRYPREDYDNLCRLYEAAVDTILFLETRDPQDKDTATLMSAGAEGWVRAWSTHKRGGLLGQFNAGHEVGYSVTHMVTDIKNRYVVTSDSMGYVKVWDIVNYCASRTMSEEELEDHRERMRNKFAFLRFTGQFEKSFYGSAVADKKETRRPPPKTSKPELTLKTPPLLNSFRAHLQAVNYMNIVNDDYLITCSSDQSVRMWTLCGRYIGTFGETWSRLPDDAEPSEVTCSMPVDLRRTASARTLWVLNGGQRPHWETALRVMRQIGVCRLLRQAGFKWSQKAQAETPVTKVQTTSVDIGSNILGVSYRRQMRHRMTPEMPRLFDRPCSIAVYHTLPFVDLSPVEYRTEVMDDINVRRMESHTRRSKAKELHASFMLDKMWTPSTKSGAGISRHRFSQDAHHGRSSDREQKEASRASVDSLGASQSSSPEVAVTLKLPPIEKATS